MDGMTTEHVLPLRVYFLVASALFLLLGVTVAIALVDLGPLNIILALLVAVVKAVLVVLYFMHVKFSSRLTWLFASGALLWLAILFSFVMADFLTR
jgi:cytochrome c oxidase subunit IV